VFLVAIILFSTFSSRADVELHEIIKTYRVVVTADNIYENKKLFGLINNKGDSSEFRISTLMLANSLCATCLCTQIPFPEEDKPEYRINQLKADIGNNSVHYFIEVILAKNYSKSPYFGIDMIEKINLNDTLQLNSLKWKFKANDWAKVLEQSSNNMDSLTNRPLLQSYIEIHKKPEKVITPLKFMTANGRMNLIYRGLWSPIYVAIPNIQAENTFIVVPGAEVKGKWGKFEVWPDTGSRKTCRIKVYTDLNNDTVLVGTHEYRIKNIPKPTAFFMGRKDSATFSLSKLRTGRFITARLEDFLYDVRFRVQSFDCAISHKNELKLYKVKGAKLSQEIREQIELLESGDRVFFQNIMATNKILQEYQLDRIVITVK